VCLPVCDRTRAKTPKKLYIEREKRIRKTDCGDKWIECTKRGKRGDEGQEKETCGEKEIQNK
jgi:hypothetical protein